MDTRPRGRASPSPPSPGSPRSTVCHRCLRRVQSVCVWLQLSLNTRRLLGSLPPVAEAWPSVRLDTAHVACPRVVTAPNKAALHARTHTLPCTRTFCPAHAHTSLHTRALTHCPAHAHCSAHTHAHSAHSHALTRCSAYSHTRSAHAHTLTRCSALSHTCTHIFVWTPAFNARGRNGTARLGHMVGECFTS